MSETETKTQRTPEEMEEARKVYIEKGAHYAAEGITRVNTNVDDAVALLQANRGHIGGFILVAIGAPGTAIVNPKTGRATDGFIHRSGIDRQHEREVGFHAAGFALIDGERRDERSNGNPLGAMMAMAALAGLGKDE